MKWIVSSHSGLRNDSDTSQTKDEKVRTVCSDISAHTDKVMEFGRDSDRDFTALARGLGRINKEMDALTRLNGELLAALSNEDDKRALTSAYTLYKNSVDLVHASMGIAVSEQERMAKVEENLSTLCHTRDEFRRNGMLFRILTMSMRMEAARIDPEFQSVFLNVAAAIADTEHRAAETTESAFNRILTVVKEAETERLELRAIQDSLHERACSSIQLIREELDKVKLALAPCIEDGKNLAAKLSDYPKQMMHIITALQYQDIVRQQLEHVASGFHDIACHVEPQSAPNGSSSLDLSYIHHATEVQQRHLMASRKEIERAGSIVVDGMRGLMTLSEDLSSRFTSMDQAADRIFSQCRIAELFKEEITKLAQIGNQSEITNSRIGKLVERIAEVVRVFSEDISHQEFEVILVALNAQVAAARMTSADALDKLAEETSRLSGANAQLTQSIASRLQEILVFLQGIKAEADDFKEIVSKERKDLEVGAERVSALLAELSEHVRGCASQVNRDFASIHEEVRNLIDGLRFPSQIPLVFDSVESLCVRILECTAEVSTADISDAGKSLLEAHRQRYTMQEEHAAHEAALGSGSRVEDPASIELFDTPLADNPAAPNEALQEKAEPDAMEQQAEARNDASNAPEPQVDGETTKNSPNKPREKKEDFGDGIELF